MSIEDQIDFGKGILLKTEFTHFRRTWGLIRNVQDFSVAF